MSEGIVVVEHIYETDRELSRVNTYSTQMLDHVGDLAWHLLLASIESQGLYQTDEKVLKAFDLAEAFLAEAKRRGCVVPLPVPKHSRKIGEEYDRSLEHSGIGHPEGYPGVARVSAGGLGISDE